MAGKDVFRRAKPIIAVMNLISGLMPRFLFTATWPIVELVPWKLGIAIRYLWAKRLAKSCGDNVVFETGVRVTYWEQIELGNNVSIFETCYLDGKGGIRIGDDVSIAHQSSLISFDFDFASYDGPMKYSPMRLKRIEIGNDCMIFSGVRIFGGAQLAGRTVIAANAVVREGTYEPGIYAGMPAEWKKPVGGTENTKFGSAG
ncbi:acyltransferase [Pseudohoeflea suaedae]|uniref:Acyltransferase n=1 Tax=Pseudohoeflea suaedae TaxID=877384 RepID=A0A4R5PP65_9HYPH|nr:acyltransferase [Pseudohoeflea suaedae]TDH38441.1 acyltransferase [Pseudohoeflea suaedae]